MYLSKSNVLRAHFWRKKQINEKICTILYQLKLSKYLLLTVLKLSPVPFYQCTCNIPLCRNTTFAFYLHYSVLLHKHRLIESGSQENLLCWSSQSCIVSFNLVYFSWSTGKLNLTRQPWLGRIRVNVDQL